MVQATRRHIGRRRVAAVATSGAAPIAHADWTLNLAPGATGISQAQYDLHMLILWICVAIGVLVFGVMLWSIIHHRRSRGHAAAHFHDNPIVEVIWTLIPLLILVAMAVPATRTLMAMYDVSDAELDVQITGYQWKWRYQYLGHDLDYFSNLSTPLEQRNNLEPKGEHYLLEVDRPLVLPAQRKVRLLMTSNDVIHAWWVPALGVKKDAIPGFINEAWLRADRPGIYRGQCAELCGKDHGFMPIVVEVLEPAQFDAWVADQQQARQAEALAADAQWSLADLVARGEQVYLSACAACHQPDGNGLRGVFPGLNGSALVQGPVDAHLDIVLAGKPGTAMAGFADQLSPLDLAAVVTYERNAWGNRTGDGVTPQQVSARIATPR